MTDNLREFLSRKSKQKFATDTGTEIHYKMQKILIDDTSEVGDITLIQEIKLKSELLQFFGKNSRVEAPVAGILKGKFVSRRIDRLVKNDLEKNIIFLDYKTDINKNLFRDKYISQMNEYFELLQKAHPDYSILGFILWVHDFTLEKVC